MKSSVQLALLFKCGPRQFLDLPLFLHSMIASAAVEELEEMNERGAD